MAGAQNEGMFGGLFARRMSAMNFAVIFKPTLLYLLSALIVSSISTASPLLCQDLAKSDELRPQTQDINQDLRALYFKEIYSHTIDQIQALNFEALVKINSSIPEKSATRLSEASEKMLDQLYQTIMTHKVVSPLIAKYDQPHVSVGYCFGRATYAHLKLLSFGLQKKSVQKIWAVGVMNTAENGKPVTWDFHVATMAYVHEKGWMVIDTHLGKVVSVNEWVQEIGALNTDGLLRFYNTDASKFGLSLGKYSRLQMGLNLPTPEDWYRGYFKDMMSSLKEETSEIQPSAIWQTLNQYTN